MEDTKLKICRLCLKIIYKNECEIVGEKLIMLETIFVGLNWTISENPVMCCECFEELQNSYNFKSACLTTEQQIKTASNGKKDEVNLWRIINENDNGSREENKICRFCLKLNANTYFNLEEKEDVRLMLQKCLPELDLFMVQEVMICQHCFAALKSLFNFVVNCLSVEDSINIYRDTKDSNSNDRVNLYDVLQFIKIKKESDGGDMCVEDFTSGNKIEEVFGKFEDVEDEELKVKSEVCVKGEPMECELVHENSMKLEDVEFQTETQAPTRLKSIHKEVTSTTIHVNSKRQVLNCNECSYQTFHLMVLEAHVLSVHNMKYKCDNCAYATDKRSVLQRHMLMHNNKDLKRFKCDKCAHSTNQRSDLQRHILLHTGTKPFVCPECSQGFTRKRPLDSHIFNRHSDNEELMKLISCKIHYCKSCDFKSMNVTNLQTHIKKHHCQYFVCAECLEFFKMKEHLELHLLNRHIEKGDTKSTFMCPKCSKHFTTKMCLARHLANWHSDKTFVCPICSKRFTEKLDLDSHILNSHSDKKEVMKLISSKIYYCNSCDYKSMFSSSLQQHIDYHHSQIFGCPKCSKVFMAKMYLDSHLLKRHRGNGGTMNSTKTFACPK